MQILLKATKNPKKKKKTSQNRSKARQERVASRDHKELAKRALKGKCGGERRENCSAASHGMARENRCRVKWRQGGQRKRRKVCNVFKANFQPTKPYLSHVTGKGKGNCNCNCYCKGNCDCNVTRNPPTIFRFLFHCPPLHPPFVSFWPFTAIESFRAHFGFWNRMRALANWIWLVCVQSSTWLQRLSSHFGHSPPFESRSPAAEKTCSCREKWQTHFAPFAISGGKFTLTLPVRLGLVFAIGCEMWHPLGEREAHRRGKRTAR